MDSISCPICLYLLKDPVTTSCGHSYCMGCLKDCWDQGDQKGIYSCPLCKESFTPRPVLRKNNLLAELVEDRKKTGLQASHPAHFYAGPGDVACDVCTGRKQKALRSCLVCLASYCETHLQSHYESPAFKKHKLVEASSQLQDKICSRHDEVMKVFCRTDQQCICLVCVMDEHKGHDTVSAAAERAEKQRQLGLGQQRVQERETFLKKLQQAVKSFNRSGQAAEKDSERIFTELIRSIERRRSEVKELIRAQQRAAVSQAEGLVERLEQEIAELRRRDAELEQLSHTEDHIHFLQSYQSLSSPSVSSDLPSISVPPLQYFSDVTKSVSELREKLEDVIKAEWSNISFTVSDVFLPPLPKTSSLVKPNPSPNSNLFTLVKPNPSPNSNLFTLVKPNPSPNSNLFTLVKPNPSPNSNLFTLVKPNPSPNSNPFTLVKPNPSPNSNPFTLVKPNPSPNSNPFTLVKPNPSPNSNSPFTPGEPSYRTRAHFLHSALPDQQMMPKENTLVDVFLPPEPKTRAHFLHYSCQLTLDPNTANKHLSLSEKKRKVTKLYQPQPYPDHPDRFTFCPQVLCREALSGRCYWEVEWRGSDVDIAVSYKDINRTDDNSYFGYNDKSWRLGCTSNGYWFRYNKIKTKVSGPQSSRVGVYLDHKAGSLSFYSISDTVTLLHRVQTTFTQPLYPGFKLRYYTSSAEISKVW